MSTFHLFRLKIEKPQQSSLFANPDQRSSDIIKIAIEEKPSRELRKGHTWKIGNIVPLEVNGIFFALGRITKSIVERYDERRGDFLEESFEEAPYTYIIIDLEYQVAAISQKSRIAQSVGVIASRLEKLLSQSNIAMENELKFTLSLINDPSEFIELLNASIRISHFEMTFSPPNPFDVDEDFHKPMERLLRAAKGDKGKTLIDGDNLDSEPLVELARSAAGTGDNAKAKIQLEGKEKPEMKNLRGNPVTITQEDLGTDNGKRSLFEKVRRTYEKIRGALSE